MKLTTSQVKEMQSKGLSLDKITQIAQKQGYEMPDMRSGLQKVASLADMLFGGGKIGEAIGTEIARFRATPEEKKFITPGPTKGEIIGSTLQSASLFTPVGKLASGITAGAKAVGLSKGVSALGKIGAGTLAGGAFDVAQNLQEGKTGISALKPGLGAVIGGAIPAVGVSVNVARRFGHETAPRVINSLIKPLQKDFSYGKNPGRAVAEAKIIANDFDDLISKIRENRQTTGQEIGVLGRKLSTKPVVDISDSLFPLDEAMRTAASQNNPILLSRLQNVKKAITSKLEPSVDELGNITIKEAGSRQLQGLTFSEARDILGQIGDITQFTGSPSDDKAVNSALKKVYGLIKEITLDTAKATDETLAKDFEKLTEKYADLSSAEIAAKYRDKVLERGSLVGFSPQVAGIGTGLLTLVATGGAATPAVLAGITGAVLDKLAQSPAFKTRLAALLAQKAPKELNIIYQKVPALQKLFPKGSPISPGDYLLGTETGQKLESSIKKSIKNPSLGLSIKDVTRNNPLYTEARKYKSAEEFVKSQTNAFGQETIQSLKDNGLEHLLNEDGSITLYHKTTPLAASNIERNGFSSDSYFADSPESANALASTNKKGGSKIIEVKVNPSDISYSPSTGEFYSDVKLKKINGIYEGVNATYSENLTKSQLTDIWNKANKK